MFHTQMKNGITFLTAGALASDGIRHGFSTRLGGVSPTPWDSLNLGDRRGDIANVQENFRRLCAALDMDVRRAVLSRQIHRDDVRLVTAADCGKGLWVPQDYDSADAPYHRRARYPAGGVLRRLQCDPAPRSGAPRRGGRPRRLAGAPPPASLARPSRAMQDAFGCDPAHIRAAIGPAIGPCCFETDNDVPAALREVLGVEAEPLHDVERPKVAHRPEGRQRPVAAKGRRAAYRPLR